MVNLVKGQKVELTKSNPGLTKINAGLACSETTAR